MHIMYSYVRSILYTYIFIHNIYMYIIIMYIYSYFDVKNSRCILCDKFSQARLHIVTTFSMLIGGQLATIK